MKTLRILVVLVVGVVALVQTARAQGTITGTVVSAGGSKSPIVGARVQLQGTKLGATTSPKGEFRIVSVPAGQYTLTVEYLGYDKSSTSITVNDGQTSTVSVQMSEGAVKVEDIIVLGASRRAEKVTDAPASIQAISGAELERVPLAAVAQAFATLKGVDFVRSGIDGMGINARGFNSAFNSRMMVITDGRFSLLPGTGLAIGNLNTNIKEDIQSMEMILGPASALYGPNAHNGTINIISKDPRTSQGTTIAANYGQQNYFSGRLRHAGAVGDVAWKATFEYMTARDWNFVDSVYQTPANGGTLPHFNPAAPQVRRMGFTAEGRGDNSVDILNIRHIRAEGSLYWNLPIETDVLGGRPDLILSYGTSVNSGPAPTNAGRNYINDWQFSYWQAKFVSPRLFAQVFNTWNNSGNTFPIQNVTNIMNGNIVPVPTLFGPLRDAARVGRVTSGQITATEAIQASRFAELSSRLNAEIQYNNSIGDNFKYVIGINYQADAPKSEGTYLGDNVAFRGDGSTTLGSGRLLSDTYITINPIRQIGGALQFDFDPIPELRITGAARLDNHDIFGALFAPKAGVIFRAAGGAFRATYGQGFVTPTPLNMFIFVPAAVIGQSTLSIIGNAEGFTLENGEVFNRLRPESVQTIEIGYKGAPIDRLFVDVSAYYQNSRDFISPAIPIYAANFATSTRVVRVGSTPVQPQYVQTYVNFGQIDAIGADVGLGYNLNDNFSLALNYSWFNPNFDSTRRDGNGRLTFDINRDGRVTPNEIAVNTPRHKGSLTLNAVNLFDGKFFGSLAVRYVSQYDFVSGVHFAGEFAQGRRPTELGGFLFNRGPLGGFTSVDLSAGYKVLSNLMVSISVTNLLDTVQREMVASPAVPRFILGEIRYDIPAFY
jgi:iron complex outermembrane receptor protein